jgi:hypothetical protein
MTEQSQPRVKFEQACFKCGSHYCLMDCVKDPEPTTKRPWVGLTDEEIKDLWSWSATAKAECVATTQQHAFARAIEAKLKDKNA